MKIRIGRAFVVGMLLGSLTAPVFSQVIRSTATRFPSVAVENAGTAGAPSISFVDDPTVGLYLYSTGNFGVAGNFLPGATATYDLGSSARQFKNLYLSGNIVGAGVGFGNGSAGAPSIGFTSAPTKGFYLDSATAIGVSGFLAAGADASYDIGLAASKRFRNLFVSGILAGAKVQVGAGAVSTSNITLRSSDTPGTLSVKLGDESADGDFNARKLTATGGVVVSTTTTQPACSAGTRGEFWMLAGAAGVADQIQVCGKGSDDAWYWLTLQ